MTRNQRPGGTRRRRSAEPGGWYSDDLLFGATGGFYPLPPRRAGPSANRPETTETFEQVYPRHDFSELVRLSLLAAGLLARLARRWRDIRQGRKDRARASRRPDLPISFR